MKKTPRSPSLSRRGQDPVFDSQSPHSRRPATLISSPNTRRPAGLPLTALHSHDDMTDVSLPQTSSPPPSLRRSTTRITRLSGAADFEMPELNPSENLPPAYPAAHGQQSTADTNGGLVYQDDGNGQARWDADASRVAARKAMAAKRQLRASFIQTSRTKSRRKATQANLSKPGLAVDTSVSRHRGKVPKQLFPQTSSDNVIIPSGYVGFVNLPDFSTEGNESGKKKWWEKLGKSNKTETTASPSKTRSGNGSGFENRTMRAQRDQAPPSIATPTQEIYSKSVFDKIPTSNDARAHASPQTGGTLQPGRFASMEVSPSDRPITIGLSIPSESLSEHEDYRTNRERSSSDATLVTPNIIITPAVMKSVWSPDTEPGYTPRPPSSIYSQATWYPSDYPNQYVPPVPSLPPLLMGSGQPAVPNPPEQTKGGNVDRKPGHARDSTLDSAVTAFEEDEEDKQKARIMSSGTLFEEDETPLTSRENHDKGNPGLSINTAIPPTPHQSLGWWNFITTPFEMSRSNSVWTRIGLGNGETTPDVPMVPQKFGVSPVTAFSPSTYIWSATEKSPSVMGENKFQSFHGAAKGARSPVSAITPHPNMRASQASAFSPNDREVPIILGLGLEDHTPSATPSPNSQCQDISRDIGATHQAPSHGPIYANKPTSVPERDITSPVSSTASATPVLGIASMGTILMPKEVHERPAHLSDIPEMERRQSNVVTSTNIEYGQTYAAQNSPPRRPFNVTIDSVPVNVLHRNQRDAQTPPQYAPPPSWNTGSHNDEETSRGSIPMDSYPKHPEKGQKGKGFGRFNCFERKKKQKQQKKEKNKRSRCCCWLSCCCIVFLALVAIIVALAVTLTRKKHHDIPSPSQWLNLTGYPPIPTGMSTIAQPEAVEEESGCVSPATIWSCALPKEQQASITPNKPDQPNFKLNIIFDNGTIADKSKTQIAPRSVFNPVSAGAFIRHKLLHIRDAPAASPAVPSLDDLRFLGNTTDDNKVPFEGEQTPFFISFEDPTPVSSARLVRRASTTAGFEGIASSIPSPAANGDGTAAAASLLPLPSAQPLMLYDRGLPTEHYGFYNYFDRSIFLKSITPTNNSFGGVPADTNGGSTFDSATMRCVWAQTRFRVQIWTNAGSTKPLLQGSRTTSAASAPSATSTATPTDDLKRPGSFPYPVTVALDRHGGDQEKKMIYCHGMDKSGKISAADHKFVLEDRSFGGTAVNPSEGPFREVTVATKDGGPGGIDGGHGGCQCQWANWLQN